MGKPQDLPWLDPASVLLGSRRYNREMATCKACDDEVDTLVTVKVGKRSQKVCEDCADRMREAAELAEEGEAAMQTMMGFKGRW